jgi:hypothetical protein
VPFDSNEAFVTVLRQDFHNRHSGAFQAISMKTTTERVVNTEIVICVRASSNDLDDEVLIGEWDPQSDDVRRPLRLPRGDFQRLFALKGELNTELLADKKESVREMYERLSVKTLAPATALGPYREDGEYDAYVLGEVVEKL